MTEPLSYARTLPFPSPKVCGLGAALVVLTVLSSATPADAHHRVPDVYRLRATIPLHVEDHPRLDMEAAIAPWNELAGLNVFVVTEDVPHVTWEAGPSNFALYPVPSRQVCRITMRDWDLPTAQHELGHCLGFEDHIHVGENPAVPDGHRRLSTMRCADRDAAHLRWSTYSGVMSYCSWSGQVDWFGADDRQMMAGWLWHERFWRRAR